MSSDKNIANRMKAFPFAKVVRGISQPDENIQISRSHAPAWECRPDAPASPVQI
jgi:hypothetical protein